MSERLMQDMADSLCRFCGHHSEQHGATGMCGVYECDCQQFRSDSLAAPLSTLPERPDEQVIDIADELRAIANEIDHHEYGPNWRVNRDFTNAAADVIDSLRARLSSLERELDGVRKEVGNG